MSHDDNIRASKLKKNSKNDLQYFVVWFIDVCITSHQFDSAFPSVSCIIFDVS